MDCKEFREVLDLYVDRELSAEATAAAGLHLGECGSCRLAADGLFQLRRAVKQAVNQNEPPPELVERIRQSLVSRRRPVGVPVIAALALALLLLLLGSTPSVRTALASGMEHVAFRLDEPQSVVLEGVIVCRECELYSLYGGPNERDLGGHHGALKTAGGKIWTFMESEKAAVLIHDESLIGEPVRVQARVYRRAGCLEVGSYEILPSTRRGRKT
jgi:hypothetical protein